MCVACSLSPVPAICIVVAATLLSAGCAAPSALQSNSTATSSAATPAINHPAGTSQTMQVVAEVLPLGSVPYDNLVLPLLNPDGRYVAVQTGAPPTWPTILAESAAEVPTATRIEIHELDWREGIKPQDRKPPTLIATLGEPALLGRSGDADGFLIESPRPDGSRWIGKVSWSKGEVQWLVTGADVNAFADLGPAGQLAWSRRSIDSTRFELVVRLTPGTDSEFTMAPSASTESTADLANLPQRHEGWLMPTWASRGQGLFVLLLENSRLDMRYALAASAAAIKQSMQRLTLTNAADNHTAYQSLSAQSATIGNQPSAVNGDQIVFYHPGLLRVAVWRPLAMNDRQRIHLNAHSIAALVDQDEFGFITTRDHLIRQNLRRGNERIDLVAGMQIPRQSASQTWPFLLLSPDEGRVGIMAMRLLRREDSVFAPRPLP